MDIFSKIENEQQVLASASNFAIVEKQGKYGFDFVRDESKVDKALFEYVPTDKSKICNKTGFWAEKRAYRFYKFLTRPQKKYKNVRQQQKAKQKRLNKIKNILEKGINIRDYFTTGMDKDLLARLPEDEIKLLYEYGYNVVYALEECVADDYYRKNIYFAVGDFNRIAIIRNTPPEVLEKIIHTRNGVNVSSDFAEGLVRGHFYYGSGRLLTNIQLLIKTGQIYLTPEQLNGLCESAKNNNIKIIPEVQAIYDFLKKQGKMPEKKYSTQKQVSQHHSTTTKKAKQSEAQEAIDKLFEEAQKASE